MSILQIESLQFQDRGPYNLTIKEGQCICLTGASGSGKTLLLRSIADLDPHQGQLYLDQSESKVFKPSDWRLQVGMLPAESRWWADRVDEHFGEVDHQYFGQFGFDSDVMTWQVSRLSTGERQRLAIIRLLCNKPKGLLLDEPTASLDSKNVLMVEKAIKCYSANEAAPVLWVSHDIEQVKRVADRHFVLDSKQLTEKEI